MGRVAADDVHEPAPSSLPDAMRAAADRDMDGGGDADGPGDLNESTLQMFLMGEDGSWVRLSDITESTGVNTTDVELFGMRYAGYVWANVSGLSLFGIAGLTDEGPGPAVPWLLILLVAASAIALIAVAVAVHRRRTKLGGGAG